MAEKSTVQCNADDKTFLLNTARNLDWALPKLMALAVRGLRVMVEGEESSDERAERMVAKLSNSATPVRRVSHMGATSGSNRSAKSRRAVDNEQEAAEDPEEVTDSEELTDEAAS